MFCCTQFCWQHILNFFGYYCLHAARPSGPSLHSIFVNLSEARRLELVPHGVFKERLFSNSKGSERGHLYCHLLAVVFSRLQRCSSRLYTLLLPPRPQSVHVFSFLCRYRGSVMYHMQQNAAGITQAWLFCPLPSIAASLSCKRTCKTTRM